MSEIADALRGLERVVARRDIELLTCQEADRLLGRRKGFTQQLVLAGQLRYVEREDGGVRIPAFVLREWLAAQLKIRRIA